MASRTVSRTTVQHYPPTLATAEFSLSSGTNDFDFHNDTDTDGHPEAAISRDAKSSVRKRACRPKVRTGCISCKKRHVKCDETKPSCIRCEDVGRVCEGYAAPRTRKQVLRPDRFLLPRPNLAPLASTRSPRLQPAGVQLTVVSSPGLGFNFSDDENFYFSLYCNKVALNLSPCHGSNNNFWSRFPLRDSMTRKSIRHSILSIGAYARALIDLKAEQPLLHTTDRPWWPTAVFNHHREAALTHHAQALACLRQEIGATGVDNRATMAATLLFIVFENMMGNYHSSGILVRRGIKVLNDMGRTQSRQFIWNTHCGAFEPPNEMDEMAHIFLRHSITSVLLPFPHGKSAFHMLFDDDDDDDDEVTANDTSEDMSLIFTTQSNVPRTFEHARTVWETLLPAIGRFYAKAAWRNLNPQYEIDDDAFIDQSLLLSRLQSFGAGLATLVLAETDCTVLHRLEFFEAHHAVAEILVSCCLDRTEMSYDDYTQEFVLALAKANAWLEGARRSTAFPSDTDFTNEVGMLPLLAFVASKCRVYAVRLDALNVLRKSRTREGPWDGISLGNAVRSLMQLEGHDDEGGVMNVFAPLSQVRYVWTNMFWDFEHRQMTMEYTKAWSDSQGDLDKVIRVVSG